MAFGRCEVEFANFEDREDTSLALMRIGLNCTVAGHANTFRSVDTPAMNVICYRTFVKMEARLRESNSCGALFRYLGLDLWPA